MPAPRRPGRARGTFCALLALLPAATRAQPSVEASPPDPGLREIHMNREFEVLKLAPSNDDPRARLALAARELGDWRIHLAGAPIDGPVLARIAATPDDEPLLRAAREELRRAVEIEDLLYLLDDVLVAGRAGHRGEAIWISPGRGRRVGVLVATDEVWGSAKRAYGTEPGWLDVTEPRAQASYPPAQEGEPLGPRWTMRFRNPSTEPAMLDALRAERPESGFAERIEKLLAQLRATGADVQVESTVRLRQRGYLMWGAFVLSRSNGEKQIEAQIAHLERRRREWSLGDVTIRWRHPLGPRATKAAAIEMADTYAVVYATEEGARNSRHYGGRAIDFTAVGLPRSFVLTAPNGQRRRFDLSDPSETRDLSLTPRLVRWIEEAFGLSKLTSDYPHWDDRG